MAAEPVLITGGCGFLGQHLANELAAQGIRPVLFSRGERRHLLDRGLAGPDSCPFFQGDVLDPGALEAAIREHGVGSVVHSAAVVPPGSEEEPYQALRINLLGTLNVLEVCRGLGLGRVTLVSSGAVYAPSPAEAREDSPFPVDTPYGFYGAAKASAEMIGLKYAQRLGVDFVSTRHGALYGPGGEGSPHYLYRLLGLAGSGEPVRLDSGADHRFEFVHIKDAVRGLALVHAAQKLNHRIYNVGAGKDYSLAQVAGLIKRHFPGAVLELGPGPVADLPQRNPFDLARIRELGYEPRWSLEEGLADLLGPPKEKGQGESA